MSNKENPVKVIGRRIRKVRKSKGLTVTRLAEKIDVTKSYLSHIETGTVDNPTLQVLNRIANTLNVHLSDLVREEEKGGESSTSKGDEKSRETPFRQGFKKAIEEQEGDNLAAITGGGIEAFEQGYADAAEVRQKMFEKLEDESSANIRRFRRAVSILGDVLADESLPSKARRDLAEEIISLVKLVNNWVEKQK